jgi:serine/threonine protein kinase
MLPNTPAGNCPGCLLQLALQSILLTLEETAASSGRHGSLSNLLQPPPPICEDTRMELDRNKLPVERLGDFEVLGELGRGGMGVVYEARQVSLNRKVALKVLRAGLGLTAQAVQRFRREAAAAAKLHHSNIVPIYATGEANGLHYYAMELIEGASLDKVLTQLRREQPWTSAHGRADTTKTDGVVANEASAPASEVAAESRGVDLLATTAVLGLEPQPITPKSQTHETSTALRSGSGYFDNVARLIAEVADALHYAHKQGVIHRDIKPPNLLLSPEGRLHLNDFGLARVLGEPGVTITGEFVGSPSYMSPEQITAGRLRLDHRTDIYSLGVVLYELLAFQPPFVSSSRDQILAQIVQKEPKPPRSLNKKVPLDMETICLKAMEKDPDRRYQQAGELAQDLRRFASRFEIKARRAGPITRTVKWIRRRPAVAAALGGCLMLALVALLLAFQARRTALELLAEQRQRSLDAALADAMSGDAKLAGASIRKAELMKVSMSQVHLLQGLVKFQTGDFTAAIDDLEQAVRLTPGSVAAHSLLAAVYNHAGRISDMDTQIAVADRLQSRTPEDLLFKGYVFSFFDAAHGVQTLDKAILARDTGIGRAIRAEARSNAAQGTWNSEDAEKARLDVAVAKEELRQHPYVLFESVYADLTAAAIYESTGQTQRQMQVLEEAGRDAASLESFIHLPDPAFGLWWYWEYTGQERKALEELGPVAERSKLPIFSYLCGLSLYRAGEVAKAAAMLNSSKDGSAAIDVLRAFAVAEMRLDTAQGIKVYEEAANHYRDRGELDFLQLALLGLGQAPRASSALREIRQSAPPYPKFYRGFFETAAAYVCNELSEDELMRRAGNERWDQAIGALRIGLRRLGEGDRRGARECFQKIASWPVFGVWDHDLGWVLLKRMEQDPGWPPWIPARGPSGP